MASSIRIRLGRRKKKSKKPKGVATKPYPFQIQGIRKIEKWKGRALLADEPGLGKTLQSLYYAWRNLENPTIVVICPATIKENWKREAAKHVGMRAEILHGRTPPVFRNDNTNSLKRNTIYIINYDIIGSSKGNARTWNKFLRRLKPDLVIIDECHYISNPDAKRTKYVRQLCHKVKHIIGISGTPLTNKPAELWTILNLVRPDKFSNRMRYLRRYCKPEFTPWGIKYTGATRLDELHAKLKKYCMIRRKKSQVLKDLPAKTRIVIPIELSDMQEYKEAEADFIGWLRKTHPHKANKARRAERLIRYGYLLRLTARLKMKGIKEWIDNFMKDSNDKMIVFAINRFVVQDLHDHYPDISTRIDGSVTKKKRQEAIDEFIEKKRIRFLFGNMIAAGVGWSGKNVPYVAMTQLGFRPGDILQAEDRAHGIGRGKEGTPTFIYFLIGKGTIEEKQAQLVQSKQRVLDSVLDGDEADTGLSIHDLLEEELLKKGK